MHVAYAFLPRLLRCCAPPLANLLPASSPWAPAWLTGLGVNSAYLTTRVRSRRHHCYYGVIGRENSFGSDEEPLHLPSLRKKPVYILYTIQWQILFCFLSEYIVSAIQMFCWKRHEAQNWAGPDSCEPLSPERPARPSNFRLPCSR